MELLRSFIAIDLPDDLRNQILQLQKDLSPITNSFIRWTKLENIHLTLKFLGDVEKQRLNNVIKILEEIACTEVPFVLFISNTGVFPNLKRPRIVWVGINQSESLTKLVQRIEDKLTILGFDAEDRPYKPHLTIGRIRSYCTLKESLILAGALDSTNKIKASFLVSQIALYRSDLKSEGAEYSHLMTICFSAGK